jgi:hypothetical protein
LDESLAERRQQLGRRHARPLDSGANRQQAAMANEMIRQTIDFWTRTGMASIAGHKPKRRG